MITQRYTIVAIFAFSLFSENLCAAPKKSTPDAPVSKWEQEAAKINYPRIFGVRPLSPFLFRLPVSGTAPIQVTAKDLPAGLTLNPANGIITGKIKSPEKKTYTVPFTATNRFGSSKQSFRIVVGDRICLTPPMGWNSWYVWSESLNETHFRDAADQFEANGLLAHGWSYVNLDDCWQGVRGGPDNALQPNEKFPNMKGAVDYLHSKGIKAGTYTVPYIGSYAGFPGSSCENPEGTYKGLPVEKRLQPSQVFGRWPGFQSFKADIVGPHWFFDKDIKQIADWGFDLIKVDWTPNDIPTAKRVSQAVRAQNRDIALSISNHATFAHAAEYAQLAEFWRTSGDIQDKWSAVFDIISKQADWAPFSGPGHWNDADMLQIGRTNTPNQLNTNSRPTRLNREEQRSQFSLWCLSSAPLLISCDLSRLDGFTLSMLKNDEMIAVNQDPLGKACTELPSVDKLKIYVKEMEDKSKVIGILNTGDANCDTTIPWNKLGLNGQLPLRDLWAMSNLLTSQKGVDVTLPSHACMVIQTPPL